MLQPGLLPSIVFQVHPFISSLPFAKKGLRDRNSPICTLSQNGYGIS